MNIDKNFNSNSASRYTLHISNEQREANLTEKEESSASEFSATVNPGLDLSQLVYLQSTECEMRLDNISIDSLPLTLSGQETINSFITIAPSLARDNFFFSPVALEKENKKPLIVHVSDFQSFNIKKILDYINKLLQICSNLFIIKRYTEIILDDDTIFRDDLFTNLDINSNIVTCIEDFNLLKYYIDIATFSRIRVIETLNQLIEPQRELSTLFGKDNTPEYTRGSLSKNSENETIKKSHIFNPISKRHNYNESVGAINPDPTKLVNLSGFYMTPLLAPTGNNIPKIETKKEDIKKAILKFLEQTGKLEKKNGKFLPYNKLYIEQIIHDNISLIKIAVLLKKLVTNEISKLSNSTNVFPGQALTLSIDEFQQKIKFNFDTSRLENFVSFSIIFPEYMSFKLGSRRDIETRRFRPITVGPITIAPPLDKLPVISSQILSSNQRVGSCIRLIPQLLCVASDILSEVCRQMEKESVMFEKHNLVTFFQMPIHIKKKDHHAISLLPDTQTTRNFFKIHHARMFLSDIKIVILDEHGERLRFGRDTITNLALTFRPALLNPE